MYFSARLNSASEIFGELYLTEYDFLDFTTDRDYKDLIINYFALKISIYSLYIEKTLNTSLCYLYTWTIRVEKMKFKSVKVSGCLVTEIRERLEKLHSTLVEEIVKRALGKDLKWS